MFYAFIHFVERANYIRPNKRRKPIEPLPIYFVVPMLAIVFYCSPIIGALCTLYTLYSRMFE